MPKRIAALTGSVIAALAGGWLILSPFALGYRPAHGPWDHATEVDVWSGVGLVAVALVALVATLLAATADLRARGALPARSARATSRHARSRASQDTEGPGDASEAGSAEAGPAEEAAGPAQVGSGPGAPRPVESDSAGPGAVASDGDLRTLLAALVQALLTDTAASTEPARPPAGPRSHAVASTEPRPPPPRPAGTGDQAEGVHYDRWRRTS